MWGEETGNVFPLNSFFVHPFPRPWTENRQECGDPVGYSWEVAGGEHANYNQGLLLENANELVLCRENILIREGASHQTCSLRAVLHTWGRGEVENLRQNGRERDAAFDLRYCGGFRVRKERVAAECVPEEDFVVLVVVVPCYVVWSCFEVIHTREG